MRNFVVFALSMSFVFPALARKTCYEFEARGYSPSIHDVSIVLTKKKGDEYAAKVIGRTEDHGKADAKKETEFEIHIDCISKPKGIIECASRDDRGGFRIETKNGVAPRMITELFDFSDEGEDREDLRIVPFEEGSSVALDGDKVKCDVAESLADK